MIGALLMTVAAVGVFAALRTAGDGPSQSVVVAATDLPIGHALTAADLRLEPATLSADATAAGFDRTADVVGAVAVAPLRAGDIVQRSAVLPPDGNPPPSRELSFAVERERALDGALQRGERVDVLATYGDGEGAFTNVVARDVPLVDVDAGSTGAGLGSSTKVTFTVSLSDGDVALRLAHATRVATVTLVRTSRAQGADPGELDDVRSPNAPNRDTPAPGTHAPGTHAPGTQAPGTNPREGGGG